MTTVDLSRWQRLFDDLGSTRFQKRVAFATGKAAKLARDTMRQSMREVLGADVRGPGGMTGRFGQPTQRTISAVEYSPPQISEVRSLSQATSSVYVKGMQGKVGQDQRAYLKYLFGTGTNTRRPGDVGMANDRILVPQNRALLLTQKLTVNPYYNGGRQAPGALSKVQARALDDQADMFGGDKRAQAMRDMAATARFQSKNGFRETPTTLAQRMAAARHVHGMGLIDHNLRHNGFDPVAVSRAAKRYAFAEDRRPRWAVFEAKDRRTGVPTYFSRPRRVRDPSGGTHQVRRRSVVPNAPVDIVDWMESHVYLTPEVTERPGPLRLNNLQKGVFRSFQEPDARWVSFQKPPRFGASMGTVGCMLYFAAHEGQDVFYTERAEDPYAKYVYKKILRPMLTAEAGGLSHLKRPDGKGGLQDTWQDTYLLNGATIQIRSAATDGAFRQLRASFLVLDECSAAAYQSGGANSEGYKPSLARVRATQFRRPAMFLPSTPLEEGCTVSHEYRRSDQRVYFVPCPHCGAVQPLLPKVGEKTGVGLNFRADPATGDCLTYVDGRGQVMPDIWYECMACDEPICEGSKAGMIERGEWRATAAPQEPGLVGFYTWAAYSDHPQSTWSDIVSQYVAQLALSVHRRGLLGDPSRHRRPERPFHRCGGSPALQGQKAKPADCETDEQKAKRMKDEERLRRRRTRLPTARKQVTVSLSARMARRGS